MSTPPRRPTREGLRDIPARWERPARQLFETAQEDLREQLAHLGQVTPPHTSPPHRMSDDESEVGAAATVAAPTTAAEKKKDPLDFNSAVVVE